MILTLDPSSSATGYAIWTAERQCMSSGVIKTSKAKAAEDKYSQHAREILRLCREFLPDLIVLEVPNSGSSYGQREASKVSLMAYAQAVTIGQTVGICLGIPIERVEVREWKKNDGKEITIARAKQFRPHVTDDNEADAIMVGWWWLTIGQHRKQSLRPANSL